MKAKVKRFWTEKENDKNISIIEVVDDDNNTLYIKIIYSEKYNKLDNGNYITVTSKLSFNKKFQKFNLVTNDKNISFDKQPLSETKYESQKETLKNYDFSLTQNDSVGIIASLETKELFCIIQHITHLLLTLTS